MEICIAFDGDEAGRQAACKAAVMLSRFAPRELVAYEFLPGVVTYYNRKVCDLPRLRKLKERHVFDKETRKEVIRSYFMEIRRVSDSELEAWTIHYQREVCEAQLDNDAKYQGVMQAWLEVLEEERKRRIELERHGAPQYAPGTTSFSEKVALIKSYFTGIEFKELFESVTGLQAMPYGKAWRYHCPLHGDGHDRNPSGSLNLDKGLWHCFGCGAGGDVFHLLYVWPPRLTFSEAMRELYEKIPTRPS